MMSRNRSRFAVALLCATTALTAVGAVPATAAAAGYYPAAVVYDNANWTGDSATINRRDLGACSRTSNYTVDVPSSMRGRVSSIHTINGSSCNYVVWWGAQVGDSCGVSAQAYAPGPKYVGDKCNDKVNSLTVQGR